MERRRSGEENKSISTRDKMLIGAAALLITGLVSWGIYRAYNEQSQPSPETPNMHRNITTTVFWVGEAADASNAHIPNDSSAWRENWQSEFGGVDDPNNRCNGLPCDFTPKENPFYAALPYNDLDENCEPKPTQKDLPWYDPNNPPEKGHSLMKNHWIKVTYNGKSAFAQLEDSGPGPWNHSDEAYVIGGAAPSYEPSGLDLSPATAEYLGIDGRAKTSWQFVPQSEVPAGPWKNIVTTSLPDCAL